MNNQRYFLNLALTQIAPLTSKTDFVFGFEIQMNHSREDGLSSNEEFDQLIEIEDQITLSLATHPILYADV